MKILLAEDDHILGKLIKDYLISESELINVVNTGEGIKEQLVSENYDVLILDMMLPKKNGIDICRELRAEKIDIAILFITALNNQSDKIKAFESGADDYLIKPFDLQELLLRVQALTRRKTELVTENLVLKWGELMMIPNEKKVYYHDLNLNLTPTEYKILQIFLESPKQVFNLDNIIDRLWDLDSIPTYNTFRSHIKSLRKKIAKTGLDRDFIETVYGMGYKLKEQLNQKQTVFSNITTNTNQANSQITQASKIAKNLQKEVELETLIEEIWFDNQVAIYQNCQQIKDYIAQHNHPLNTEEIIRIIHNLSGCLGSIGFKTGTIIAKQIESLLRNNNDHLCNSQVSKQVAKLADELEKTLFPDGKPLLEATKSTQDIQINQQINILVVNEDQKLTNKLILFIEHPQINLSFAYTISSAVEYLKEQKFQIILVETIWQNQSIEQSNILSALMKNKAQSQILIYTQEDSLENRLYCNNYPIFAFLTQTNCLDILWNNLKNIILNTELNSSVKERLYDLLIIDDDQIFIRLLENKLKIQQLPINIYSISNSEKFLDTIKEIKPQLIILDLQMPKLNGLDICKIIKTDPFLQKIPVIFLTGNLTPEAIEAFVKVGADDFISKSKIDVELYPRIMTHLKRFQFDN